MNTIEEIYKLYTPRECVLNNPNSYIGTMKPVLKEMRIYDENTKGIILKNILISEGFLKIFDEILMNAFDHTKRDLTCDEIKINVDKITGFIGISNNGCPIPVDIHKVSNKYIPEIVFFSLTNPNSYHGSFANGLGAKLTNIFSKYFAVMINDVQNNVTYFQDAKNNMETVEPPVISYVNNPTKSFTKIEFVPDYERFDMDSISDDMYALLKKRAYDIKECCNSRVHVMLNDEEVLNQGWVFPSTESNNGETELYPEFGYIMKYGGTDPFCCFEIDTMTQHDFNKVKIGILYGDDIQSGQISFVNGINTYDGGMHVEHIKILLAKQIKKYYNIPEDIIFNNIILFINFTWEDPSFENQSKTKVNRLRGLNNININPILYEMKSLANHLKMKMDLLIKKRLCSDKDNPNRSIKKLKIN